jgi:hypothetical protein
MAQYDISFSLNSNITNKTIPHPMPRITAVYRKRPKISQMLLFLPLFYQAVMMFEEVQLPLP